MGDAQVVREREPLSDLCGNRQGRGDGEAARRSTRQTVFERLAAEQLHHQVGMLTVLHDVVEGANVRVREARQHLCLAFHPSVSVAAATVVVAFHSLDGHVPRQA